LLLELRRVKDPNDEWILVALSPAPAPGMAAVLLHNMKAMRALVAESGEAGGAAAERREMTRLDLASTPRDDA
jgi:hypothetical protein